MQNLHKLKNKSKQEKKEKKDLRSYVTGTTKSHLTDSTKLRETSTTIARPHTRIKKAHKYAQPSAKINLGSSMHDFECELSSFKTNTPKTEDRSTFTH
jgi:hypothetical protein